MIWLVRRLTPDDRTIADFRKDNGPAIKKVCARFVDLCRQMRLLTKASVAIDGSKFKAVNTRDKKPRRCSASTSSRPWPIVGYYNSTKIKACDDAGIAVTLPKPMTSGSKADGRFGKQDFVYDAAEDVYRCPAGGKLIYRMSSEEGGKIMRRYWTNACPKCPLKSKCTTGNEQRIPRWEHEHILEAA